MPRRARELPVSDCFTVAQYCALRQRDRKSVIKDINAGRIIADREGREWRIYKDQRKARAEGLGVRRIRRPVQRGRRPTQAEAEA